MPNQEPDKAPNQSILLAWILIILSMLLLSSAFDDLKTIVPLFTK